VPSSSRPVSPGVTVQANLDVLCRYEQGCGNQSWLIVQDLANI